MTQNKNENMTEEQPVRKDSMKIKRKKADKLVASEEKKAEKTESSVTLEELVLKNRKTKLTYNELH